MFRVAALRRLARFGLAAALSALVACSRSDTGPAIPEGTIYFGTLSGTPVAFTLSGTVRYQDRIYGVRSQSPLVYGFTGEIKLNPVRYAIVDVVDENDQVLQSTHTDAQGHYTFSLTTSGLLHLRVLARSDAATGIEVGVKNTRGEWYGVTKYFVPGAGSFTLDADIDIANMAGAFNILDLYTAAAEFLYSKEGRYPPPLKAVWEPGSSEGTYFNTGDNTVYILGGSAVTIGDTDEYDDDVLLHEYGHFVETVYGNIDSMGGAHHLSDNTQDLRLAWSEGWASFTSGVIKKWLKKEAFATVSDSSGIDSLYIDTIDDTASVKWVFDAPFAANDLNNSYSSCETAVAKILWSIDNEFGYQDLWRAYRAFTPSRTRPVSLETFWDNWLATNTSDPTAAFAERNVIYATDSYDTLAASDNSAASATAIAFNIAILDHTLYTHGDSDYYSITLNAGVSYTVETFGLINGADTQVKVYEPAAATPAFIDDNVVTVASGASASLHVNDGCTLASRITFTPALGGLYTLQVSSASPPSLAAGRYGAYKLKISQAPLSYQCP